MLAEAQPLRPPEQDDPLGYGSALMRQLRTQGVLPPIDHSLGYVVPAPVEPRPPTLLQGAGGAGPAEVRLGVVAGLEEGPEAWWGAAREEAEGVEDVEEAVRGAPPQSRLPRCPAVCARCRLPAPDAPRPAISC